MGTRDRHLLVAAAFLRAVGIGTVGVLLAVYLARLGLAVSSIGVVVGAGLAGGAVATLLVTVLGDRASRRGWLVALDLAMAIGAFGVVFGDDSWRTALLAFVGMVNGMGRDRGAALVLEQAALPSTTDDRGRTAAFAWYNLAQDVGHALGGLLAAAPALLTAFGLAAGIDAERMILTLPALLLVAGASCHAALSSAVETPSRGAAAPLSASSRRALVKLSGLFALDSIGGGFLVTALLAYYLHERFGVDEGVLGPLFFCARLANAGSHLLAARLARRIGLVNTMVFTHIPSSLLLLTVPLAPSFPVAALLFLLREALVEMDVPTRQSYVMAIVAPDERTRASGVTHLVRLAGWAVAPSVAGLLMQEVSQGAALWVGAGLKIAYDLLLYASFRALKPPEEVAEAADPPPRAVPGAARDRAGSDRSA